MRLSCLLLILLAAPLAHASPATTLIPVDASFCKTCKRVAQQKLPGIGTVEVLEDRQGPSIQRIAIVIPSMGGRTGAVLAEYGDARRVWAVRETPRIQAYDEGSNHDVGLLLDLDLRSAPPDTHQHTRIWTGHLAIACGSELVDEGTRLWNCRTLEIGVDGSTCQVDKWSPPTLETTCKSTQQLSAR